MTTLHADERKVKQVLLNLLSNALKFTPEGGAIDVQVSATDKEVEVAVKDTGVGIAPDEQDSVFEEFRQVGSAVEEDRGHRPRTCHFPQVRRASRREDLGDEPAGRGLDVRLHVAAKAMNDPKA